MNLERSSVQIVHSSGKFRAVFCQVRSILFLRVDFLSEFGLEFFYRKHTTFPVFSFFPSFAFFQLRVRPLTAVRFWFSFLYPQKTRVSSFFFLSCFFSRFFHFFVTSDERGQGYAAVVLMGAAPQPTATIQQHHNNSSRKRARVCLCERGKFATQALFSVQVMALRTTNREVNMTAGEVLFLERASSIISSDCHMASEEHKQRSVCFQTCFFSSAHATKAQTKLRKPQHLRTARTREQPSIGPAQSSRVHTSIIPVVRSCRPACDNASKQA